jgi:cytochrome c553
LCYNKYQQRKYQMKTLILATLLAISAAAQAQDLNQGKAKYATCAACHGAQGQGGLGKKLTGQTADYTAARLTAYKNKQQVGPQSALMWGIAAGLSDADIKNLSAHIATMK